MWINRATRRASSVATGPVKAGSTKRIQTEERWRVRLVSITLLPYHHTINIMGHHPSSIKSVAVPSRWYRDGYTGELSMEREKEVAALCNG